MFHSAFQWVDSSTDYKREYKNIIVTVPNTVLFSLF